MKSSRANADDLVAITNTTIGDGERAPCGVSADGEAADDGSVTGLAAAAVGQGSGDGYPRDVPTTSRVDGQGKRRWRWETSEVPRHSQRWKHKAQHPVLRASSIVPSVEGLSRSSIHAAADVWYRRGWYYTAGRKKAALYRTSHFGPGRRKPQAEGRRGITRKPKAVAKDTCTWGEERRREAWGGRRVPDADVIGVPGERTCVYVVNAKERCGVMQSVVRGSAVA
ncbi:hypothetical protein B0H13DRAFT_2527358 [Mycena leptocephala]|nr:hypothetical protein B0H13DRAFT_2527358 [Mycena leptocephala]